MSTLLDRGLDVPPVSEAPRARRRLTRRIYWPLVAVICLQVAGSLTLVFSNTASNEEGSYIWAGTVQLAHWFNGAPLLNGPQYHFHAYFSGTPQLYPVLAAAANALGGLTTARLLSLLLLVLTTLMLYRVCKLNFGRRPALVACAVWGTSESALRLGALATYDSLALCGICAAIWLVIEAGWNRRRHALLVTFASACLALAGLVGYSYALYLIPVFLVAHFYWKSRLSPSEATAATLWLVGLSAALFSIGAFLLDSWSGLLFSMITGHAQTFMSVSTVLQALWSSAGLPFFVTVPFAAYAALRTRSSAKRRTVVVLLVAALLVPLYQLAFDRVTWDLDLHIAPGLWIALLSLAAGLSYLDLGRVARGARTLAVSVFVSLALVTGWLAARSVMANWPNATGLVAALHRSAEHERGNFAETNISLSTLEYYTLPESEARVTWVPTNFPGTNGRLKNGKGSITVTGYAPQSLVVLSFSNVSKGHLKKLLGLGTAFHDRGALPLGGGNTVALFRLATALAHDRHYRLVSSNSYDSGWVYGRTNGVSLLWERVHPHSRSR